MRKSVITFSACLGLFLQSTMAQPSVQKLQTQLRQTAVPVADFTINQQMPEQASLLFDKKANLPITGVGDWLSTNFQFRANTDALVQKAAPAIFGSFEVQKMQQYFKGIPVEHGIINATAKNGKLSMLQMEFYPVEDGFKTTPTITEDAARDAAIQNIAAKKYAWQEVGSKFPLPAGKIVIIADVFNNNKPTLAYKFDIYAIQPFTRAFVYVNANNGSVLLVDNQAFEANVVGQADTKFSGRQAITTDMNAGSLATPYRLVAVRNGDSIKTLNYGYRDQSAANNALATDFTDDDNNWNSNEHGPTAATPNGDDAALEAHFNMQLVSDYWKLIQSRNGWDDKNSVMTSYVHVTDGGTWYNNAVWSVDAMYFGDGDGGTSPAQVSIDDCGHELGHAICQSTAALVYRWESGALNEAFSDIWAACITNYAKTTYPALPGNKSPWRLFEESSNPTAALPGLRDLRDPTLFGNPSTYKGQYWTPASFDVCPKPSTVNPPGNNDHCGVHNNSGVLNKWFYLITNGADSTNSFGKHYVVAGIGFAKSEKIAYLTELNLTPNAGFKTTRNASVNAAIALYGDAAEAQAVRDAWIAVGVDSTVFNMSNTAAFTTNSFSTIAVGKNGAIWAGTSTGANGLYRYNGVKWEQANVLLQNAIQGMTVDKNGGIWIAQSGRLNAQALIGGVNYFSDSSFGSFKYYSTYEGLISRNARSIFVDTSRTTTFGNPVVWVSTYAQVTGGVSSNGGIGTGLNTYVPVLSNYFSKQAKGIDGRYDTGGSFSIGGNGSEVWAYAPNNFGRSQIVVYDAATKDSINHYDSTNSFSLTSNFNAKAIYFDVNNNKWLGMQQNGLVVMDRAGLWHKIDTATFRNVLPYGTIINNNAITGDKLGNVYIGTSTGLVYYNRGPITSPDSYRRFTTAQGLPSNNVRAIAVDNTRYKLLVATDNGIVFFDQQCKGWQECKMQIPNRKSNVSSLGSGNWSDPAIWSNNTIPDLYTDVLLLYPVTVDINATCATLKVVSPGSVTVNAGKKLTIAEDSMNSIQTSKKF
jgi:Zn-dependent metalloprotease